MWKRWWEGSERADQTVRELAPDTLFFTGSDKQEPPYIISKRNSPFVQFCVLAEALVEARDKLVRTYVPTLVSDDSDSDESYDDDLTLGLLNGNIDRPRSPDVEKGVPVSNEMLRDDRTDEPHSVQPATGMRSGLPAAEYSLRNRTTRSPTRTETFTVDMPTEAAHEPHQEDRRRYTEQKPFGDVTASVVARLLPMFPVAPGSQDQSQESAQFCRIDRVELWSAYRVYMTMREEDAGLLRSIRNGSLSLAVQMHSMDPAREALELINEWRMDYAEKLNVYNTTMDTYVAKTGIYLGQLAARGDNQAASLARLSEAVGDAKASILPSVKTDVVGGTREVLDDES